MAAAAAASSAAAMDPISFLIGGETLEMAKMGGVGLIVRTVALGRSLFIERFSTDTYRREIAYFGSGFGARCQNLWFSGSTFQDSIFNFIFLTSIAIWWVFSFSNSVV